MIYDTIKAGLDTSQKGYKPFSVAKALEKFSWIIKAKIRTPKGNSG
jgi:hypothetical protein